MSRKELLHLISKHWGTPNTYCNNYDMPPELPGVYVILGAKNPYSDIQSPRFETECIYVGSSKNLYRRYLGHPVRRNPDYWWTGFYFKPEPNYIEIEKKLIRGLRPLLNIQHNG